MIVQISTGEGFGGLVNYANDIIKKDTVIIASYGVNLSSNATITASFKAQAKARPTIQKFVGHISLSFSLNPAKRNVLDLKNETCKNREKRNVLKISHTRHFKTTKKQSKTGCFYSF